MRFGGFSPWAISATLLLGSHPAFAAWPPDGLQVSTASGDESLETVVADGSDAIFVCWSARGSGRRQILVQRLLPDGSISAGWPVGGVAPASGLDPPRDVGRVVPDGLGGCFVAWTETVHGPFEASVYVRLQRLTSTGVRAPGWPSEGLAVATGGFSDTFSIPDLAGLFLTADGSCVLIISWMSGGCHDGPCSYNAGLSLARVNPSGTILVDTSLERSCAVTSAVTFTSAACTDGGIGLYLCTYSPCTGQSHIRHVVTGSEPGLALPVTVLPQILTRLTDGTLLARARLTSGTPTMFHWNPDGTPAPGAPATGVPLPFLDSYWSYAADAAGTSFHAWRNPPTSSEVRALRIGPNGEAATGWDPAGVLVAGPPATPVERHSIAPDGSGGVHVVWGDARNTVTGPDLFATHLMADGSVHPGLPNAGYPLCEASGNQRSPSLVTLESGVVIAIWQDGRSEAGFDIYAQRLPADPPVPAQASLARAEASADRVSLEWRLSEPVAEVAIERSRDGEAWEELARVAPGSLGRVVYVDTDVRPGESLGYRLAFVSDGTQVRTPPAWVDVPAVSLALRVLASPARGRLAVELSLPSDEPARLELVDVTGRQRRAVDVRGEAGLQRVELDLADIEPSVAWLRLRQRGESRTLRLAITR